VTQSSTTLDVSPVNGPPQPPALLVERDLQRNRVTVAFRLLLLIPQFIAVYALYLVAVIVLLVGWFAALVLGRLPGPIARYLGHFVRYSTRVFGYYWFLTDKYPPFRLSAEDYPIRVELAPGRLNRLAVLFRLFLAIPAAIVYTLVAAGWAAASFFIWLLVLAMGEVPGALYDATTAIIRYGMRFSAYVLLLTAAYPSGLFGDEPAPAPAPAPAALPDDATAPAPMPGPAAPGELSPAQAAPAGPGDGLAAPPAARGVLTLSRGAKQLVVLFLVLGVWQYAAGGAIAAVTASRTVSSTQALQSLTAAHDTLASSTQKFQQDVGTCSTAPEAKRLTCVQTADRDLATAFETFANRVEDIKFPASASAEAARVVTLGHEFANSLQGLVAAPTPEEYTKLTADTDRIGSSFDQQYQALVNKLAAA